MRIDIGPEGEVIATKKITANGTVSGLKAHAGREVLIVASNGPPTYRTTPRERLDTTLRGARVKVAEFRLQMAAEGGPLEMVRRRAPSDAVDAMDRTKVRLNRARHWVADTRKTFTGRAEEARAKAIAARRRVEAKTGEAKGDIEARAKSLRRAVEANASRRRQEIEERVEAIRRDVEARWDTGRRQVGTTASRIRDRVVSQAPKRPVGAPRTEPEPGAATPGVN